MMRGRNSQAASSKERSWQSARGKGQRGKKPTGCNPEKIGKFESISIPSE
jgi:hypothetical protein